MKRTYGDPRTPYQNMLSSKKVSNKKKRQLTKTYLSLNPAELKRRIEEKQNQLLKLKQLKEQERSADLMMEKELINQQNLIHSSVANLIAEQIGVR